MIILPRDLAVMASGVIIGALLNSRREPCRRACCLPNPAPPIEDMSLHIASSGAKAYRRFIQYGSE